MNILKLRTPDTLIWEAKYNDDFDELVINARLDTRKRLSKS